MVGTDGETLQVFVLHTNRPGKRLLLAIGRSAPADRQVLRQVMHQRLPGQSPVQQVSIGDWQRNYCGAGFSDPVCKLPVKVDRRMRARSGPRSDIQNA